MSRFSLLHFAPGPLATPLALSLPATMASGPKVFLLHDAFGLHSARFALMFYAAASLLQTFALLHADNALPFIPTVPLLAKTGTPDWQADPLHYV